MTEHSGGHHDHAAATSSVAKIDERSPAAEQRGPKALRPFRTPAYRRLALALVLSTFASGVWVVALVWEVIRIGGGPAQLSIVSTSSAVGVLLPALLAGVLADRIPQKTILLCVAAVEFGGMLLVAFLSLSDLTQIWHLAAVTFVTGMGMAFYYSAYSAWLPALVPESDLMAVNGFEGMVRPTIGQAAGPALAGFLVGALSSGAAVAIAAACAGAGLFALSLVPKTPVRRDLDADAAANPVATALADMREGFVYMVRTPWLLATLLFASVMILVMMGPFEVLIPVPGQGSARGRPRRPRARDGGVRDRRRGRLAGDGLDRHAPPLPHDHEPDVGRRLPAPGGDGDGHRDLGRGGRSRGAGRHVLRPHGDLGHAAPASGPAGASRPGRLAGLLRVDLADADLDGAGRPGVRGDRAAQHVPHCRRGADGGGGRRDRVGAAAAGRARAPVEGLSLVRP